MRHLLIAASLLMLTAPAYATEWIDCGDVAEQANVGLLLGGDNFDSVVAIRLRAGDTQWTSNEAYGPGDRVDLDQSHINDDRMIVDLTDENHNGILAELRVFIAEEGDDYVKAGTLRIAGQGAWAVECVGP